VTRVSALPDRLLGFFGAAMILAAVVVFFRGGPTDASAPSVPPPPIEIVAPASGAVLDGPLEIVFRLESGELSRFADGWGLGNMHLHIDVDAASFMPATKDITRLPDGSYHWSFGVLGPGEHEIRIYWSDVLHQPLAGGGSRPIRVRGS
jgi:hypothetical protein